MSRTADGFSEGALELWCPGVDKALVGSDGVEEVQESVEDLAVG
jgi:hypothetical protein